MSGQHIILVTYGQFESDFLRKIADDVSVVYGCSVTINELHIDLVDYYNPSRRQYDANSLLSITGNQSTDEAIKTVGLFRVDLYIPVLTYIFGQAYLSGRIAIASLYRLRNELYGLKKDDDLLLERFIKVVIHELGHSFGLIHCHNQKCVMRSSTYVEGLDQKGKNFCLNCHGELIKVYTGPVTG